MRVLVLGASGMIGNAMIRVFSEKESWEVFGTVRSGEVKRFFIPTIAERLVTGIDVENHDTLVKIFAQLRPDVVINCAGLTKHLPGAEDHLVAIPINTLMPHRLAGLCDLVGARLIHISTDCVFSGKRGEYTEDDPADAVDVYGKSKFLGEVNYPHAITLRTSTIGHELQSTHGLLDWFLSQHEQCKGFTRAIFSGLPTVVFAQVIRDIVIPRTDLFGLYHVAGKPIAKYDLLRLIAEAYGKSIEIVQDDQFTIDRSLIADRFHAATGYIAPDWPELIKSMHSYQ
ncbi:dTDP-4-dehydrorhamnose reductase family protein [Sulfuriferula nivalis]|uniref:dTDP-4-dehydrorhamnose reductase n=1 Tax=Sulfuriferula nivalis TaxID=2675298 RepID=A0A809RDU0_9PROT|nr:SDR family oxidoreductase [Sulfuriferula nivalis]BBO99938.1 NAD(P)-dependent oxidoreductase [Sulfuriferula nivalis]